MNEVRKGLLYIGTVLIILFVAISSYHFKPNISGQAVKGYVIKDFSGKNVEVPDNIITVGIITPLTGEFAFMGNDAKVGFSLAEDDVEHMLGKDVQFIYKDSACDPAIASSAAENLLSEGAEFIIGADCYSNTPLVVEGVVLNVNPSKDSLNPYSFSFASPAQDEMTALFGHVKPLPATLSIIYPNDDLGQEVLGAAKQVYGGKVISAYQYSTQQDAFGDIAMKIQERNPEVVLIVATHPDQVRRILNALRSVGYDNTVLTNIGISQDYLAHIGTDAYDFEGVTMVTDLDLLSSRTKTQDFITKVQEEYGVVPSTYTANAYDALMILGKMVKTQGENPVAVGDALHKLYNYEGVTGVMTMNKNSLTRTWYVHSILDGKVVSS